MNDEFRWQVAVPGVRAPLLEGSCLSWCMRLIEKLHGAFHIPRPCRFILGLVCSVDPPLSRPYLFHDFWKIAVTVPDFSAAAIGPVPRMEISKGPGEKLLTPENQCPVYLYARSPIFPLAVEVPRETVFVCINHFHALCTQLRWYSEKNAAMTTATTDGIWSVSKLWERSTAALPRFAYLTLSWDTQSSLNHGWNAKFCICLLSLPLLFLVVWHLFRLSCSLAALRGDVLLDVGNTDYSVHGRCPARLQFRDG